MNRDDQADTADDSFITRFQTGQGTAIHTRLIAPQDAPLLVDLFDHLSPETRWRRFHIQADRVERKRIQETAQQLADVDNHTNGGAVLAFTETGELVGVARLARPQGEPESDQAEVAVVVRDDYQQQGIGSVLMELLVSLARRMGILRLTAIVQADNNPVLTMARRLQLPVQRRARRGEIEMEIWLGDQKKEQ